ncbi:1067_t:CDS:2 [Ambispora leptoticha]|uniref:1067_t:CDS:1 n=1 Tax=Ambispora leptoticha TaxID=144679 RepID=A0A9N8VTN0_9GLOM|nr:1067_t:CDS:2 [Ambispora leptoticha]
MLEIDENLVKKLIQNQFPKWGCLSIRPVEKSGHDNRTFYLGDKMTIRLPSGKEYASQVEKELFWLPKLKKYLSLPIPIPLAKGKPTDLNQFAVDLAGFLSELQAINTSNGPRPGKHNFYRGGDLSVYHEETQTTLKKLKSALPTDKLNNI